MKAVIDRKAKKKEPFLFVLFCGFLSLYLVEVGVDPYIYTKYAKRSWEHDKSKGRTAGP